ncbi:MAG: histidine kinase [Bacteroidota bacterium]|nr:histidine kinase [Bacteroidota bacterium]
MKRKYVILLHIAFWVLLLANNLWGSIGRGILSGHQSRPIDLQLFCRYSIIEIGFLLLPVTCFYSACLLVAPQLIEKKKYVKAALLAVLLFFFVVAFRYVMEYYFFVPVLNFDNYRGHPYSPGRYLTNVFFVYFPSYFVYGLMYFFVEDWYRARQRQQEFEKEKATAELTFLRSQLNPHFLFNSINDIYSLTYQQSEQAPAALLKLSEILRYMLGEGGQNTVSLQSEVSYLENVIALQRISTKGAACINFNIEGYIGGQQIATLLLIAFVENAFKHGILNDTVSPVDINLHATNEEIQFSVRNKKNDHQKDKTSGIGLNNVRRRLELMYPGKHILTIDDGPEYTVNLTLQLT